MREALRGSPLSEKERKSTFRRCKERLDLESYKEIPTEKKTTNCFQAINRYHRRSSILKIDEL